MNTCRNDNTNRERKHVNVVIVIVLRDDDKTNQNQIKQVRQFENRILSENYENNRLKLWKITQIGLEFNVFLMWNK